MTGRLRPGLPPVPPRMKKLPRWHGWPVPWVAEWSSGRFDVDYTPTFGARHRCRGCVPGRGVARLGSNCVERQRRGVLRRLCGGCGTSVLGELIFIGEAQMNAAVEPPLHEECALFSLRACPVLDRGRERAGVVVVREYELAEQRLLGVSEDGKDRKHLLLPYGQGAGFGLLNFFVAVLGDTGSRYQAEEWLALADGKRA